jgi:acetylornithine/LysW-gamma-L-lysine aminotransferase
MITLTQKGSSTLPQVLEPTAGSLTQEETIALEDSYGSGADPKRPLTIVRGQGARLWDAEGNEYIDCTSGHGVANLGHCHPAVTEAIQAQAARLVTSSAVFYNDQRAALLKELAGRLPGDLQRVFLCNSGAEAAEGAIKVSRLLTGRPSIVATMRGFHGRTMGALSATWNKKYREPFEPLVPGFSHVPYNNLDAMADAVGDDTAAVLVEIVQGEGGVHPGDAAYFAGLRRLCDERGALLVADEIQTGFGRTGRWFACQHFDLLPDIICLGKAIGGGVPMGAFAWRAGLGALPEKSHGSTFGGNPLACAVARAVLRVMAEEELPARADRLGQQLLDGLRAIESPLVREVRGLGLMVGLELRVRVTPTLKALMERGILALPAGRTVLRLLPPLVIAEEDLETVVATIGEVLADG